ncbi:MAG: hypothetical protein EP338_10885 [Bacteroidetes bacterium]|nr:MAG: hypothetical protein EP338_10885 [Bacteroidota bacterium]
MKLTYILATLLMLSLGGLQSCQSEYAERMSKAMELKHKHQELMAVMNESGDSDIRNLLSELEKEIQIQAKISGNEDLFMKELWGQ